MSEPSKRIGQRVLLLIRLDAHRLYERLKYRAAEYIGIFALKRNRDHFHDVFRSRYDGTTIDDLKHCSEEALVAIDNFYASVEELRWYLFHTEDMPNTVDETVQRHLHELDRLYDTMNLYINAELGYQEETKSGTSTS